MQVHALVWNSYVQVGGPDSSSSSGTLSCSCSSRNCFTRAKLTSLLILGQRPGMHTLLSSLPAGLGAAAPAVPAALRKPGDVRSRYVDTLSSGYGGALTLEHGPP